MGFFDFLKPKKKRTLLDELEENPLFQQQEALFELMAQQCESGCDADEIPNGTGDFGFDVNNPIPTKTPMGSISYLGRLRASDGSKVSYDRVGSTSSSTVSKPVDIYAISHLNGSDLGTLFISAYHKRNSNKAPKGFTLAITILHP